jgi:L-ribulokinase
MLPKVCEILRCAPEVYSAAHRFIEAGDWISLMLTGKETRSPAFAGYKSCYIEGIGYPRKSFMQALDGRLCDLFGKKIPNKVSPITSTAGTLSAKGAALCGLTKGCAVSLPMIDAHAPMVALNLVGEGDMIATLGTSGCYIIHSKTETCISGIGGYVRDGVIPDMITYEAGQAAVGDMFAWFVDRYMPFEYMNAAARRGISIHKLLREKAESLRPGQSGLLCLDWLNGNRSVLSDPSLSGMILGIDLQTKPEEIYRALIEASAYGARIILEAFAGGGVECRRIVAAGGIAQKDEMMMQIYADVFNMEIKVTRVGQGGALGAAIYAAYAAGEYDSVEKASAAMACRDYITYTPIPENAAIYQQLYLEYKKLHDFFGKQNFTMHKLKELKNL